MPAGASSKSAIVTGYQFIVFLLLPPTGFNLFRIKQNSCFFSASWKTGDGGGSISSEDGQTLAEECCKEQQRHEALWKWFSEDKMFSLKFFVQEEPSATLQWFQIPDERTPLRGPSVENGMKVIFSACDEPLYPLWLLRASIGHPVGPTPEVRQQQSTFSYSRSYAAPVAIKIVLRCFAANRWSSNFLGSSGALVQFCLTTMDYDFKSMQTCHVSAFLMCWALATARGSVQSLLLTSHRWQFHLFPLMVLLNSIYSNIQLIPLYRIRKGLLSHFSEPLALDSNWLRHELDMVMWMVNQ